MNPLTRRILSFGPYLLDPEGHTLLRDRTPISLKPKVFDLLFIFWENFRRLLTKEELIGRLWPEVAVEDHNLAVAVHELRKALGDASNPAQYIETVPRIGYRFGVAVEVTEVTRAPAIKTNHHPCPAVALDQPKKEDRNGWTKQAVLSISLIAGVLFFIFVWQKSSTNSCTSYPVAGVTGEHVISVQSDTSARGWGQKRFRSGRKWID